jgi:DNA-binding CsgD family transcriptional regulator
VEVVVDTQDVASRWPFLARDSELAQFEAAWANRRCQGLVIFGLAGVGKSLLAEKCLAVAMREGWKGRRVMASAAAAAVPLGAIAHLLPAGVELSDPIKGFAEVARTLAGPQGNRRWALLVDDLHLLDSASAVLLRQLLDAGVVRLIGTVRTGEPASEAVDALTGGDAVHRIDLSTFRREQAGALLEVVLGAPVGQRTQSELYTASGGNALFLRELVLGALTAGSLVNNGEIWEISEDRLVGTPQLTELIDNRLAAADPQARPVLELLSLCAPMPLADAQSVGTAEILAALEEAGLVQVVMDQRRTTIQLSHPLYGEVLRARLPASRQRTLLLDQVERTKAHGMRRRDDMLHTAAWQLAATGVAEPTLLMRGAVLARHAHDYPQTIALLQAVPAQHYTSAARLTLAEALFQVGRWDQAEVVLAEADHLATTEQEKLAATLARTTNLLWGNAAAAQALTVNERALAHVGNVANRHILQMNEAFIRTFAGQPTDGFALLEKMENDIDQASDVGAWLRGAFSKTTGMAMLGHTSEAVTWAEHAYASHLRVDEHALVSHSVIQRIPLVLALTENGRLSDAAHIGRCAYSELESHNTLVAVWLALAIGRAQWLAGHPATARHWYAEAAALARTINYAMALRPALGGLAACGSLLGDQAAAETALTEQRTMPVLAPGFLPAGEECLGEVWYHAACARFGEARAMLAEAARIARDSGNIASETLLLTDIARLGGAKDCTARLAELAQHSDGTFALARSHLAAALAANDANALEMSARELEQVGAHLLAAEAATTAAAAWRRQGQIRRASAAGQQAATCAARCEGAYTSLLVHAESAVLTSREREIALLAANGTASKDIARMLHLSARTVDNHLQHAYAKLGVTTRRALADALDAAPTRAQLERRAQD